MKIYYYHHFRHHFCCERRSAVYTYCLWTVYGKLWPIGLNRLTTCVYNYTLIGIQLCLFPYVFPTPLSPQNHKQWQSGVEGSTDQMPPNLKYFLSDPLQENFANPWKKYYMVDLHLWHWVLPVRLFPPKHSRNMMCNFTEPRPTGHRSVLSCTPLPCISSNILSSFLKAALECLFLYLALCDFHLLVLAFFFGPLFKLGVSYLQ